MSGQGNEHSEISELRQELFAVKAELSELRKELSEIKEYIKRPKKRNFSEAQEEETDTSAGEDQSGVTSTDLQPIKHAHVEHKRMSQSGKSAFSPIYLRQLTWSDMERRNLARHDADRHAFSVAREGLRRMQAGQAAQDNAGGQGTSQVPGNGQNGDQAGSQPATQSGRGSGSGSGRGPRGSHGRGYQRGYHRGYHRGNGRVYNGSMWSGISYERLDSQLDMFFALNNHINNNNQ